MPTQVCTGCPHNGPQPISNFAKKGFKHNRICKACKRQYNKLHYARNRRKYFLAARQRRRRIRAWLDELKTTLKCNRCSESHPATLHFHHTNRKEKTITIANSIRLGWNKRKILAEIALCEVVCANCHAKEHWHLSD